MKSTSINKLIVAGTRTATDMDWIYECLDEWVRLHGMPACILCGGARGADAIGARWAQDSHIEVDLFIPDWASYGKRAGPLRNEEMAKNATHLIVFWDYKSRGTHNMLTQAYKHHLIVWVYPHERPISVPNKTGGDQ